MSTDSNVWQQLNDMQFGRPITWLVNYMNSILPTPTTDQPANPAIRPYIPTDGSQQAAGTVVTTPGAADGMQLFGLFVSRYFLMSVLAGFTISRIHLLVHRIRRRPVRLLTRLAIHSPAYVLLVRSFLLTCLALNQQQQQQTQWMQQPISYISQITLQFFPHWHPNNSSASLGDRALWLSFATICLFDCVDVFVARLEGSPCAPYEYIGGLLERMPLYYFYGTSIRVQELALLHVLEKWLLSHCFILLASGWRWRLVPTGIVNLLMLHHFVYSVLHTPTLYPLVQILSMLLFAGSLTIVLVTVSVRRLAYLVDKYGIAKQTLEATSRHRIRRAVYRNNAFYGIAGDEEEETAAYELDRQVWIPLCPDFRRDFGVEILDLASTCLKQCSSQVRSTGFSRPSRPVRLPKTTALDEYIDRITCTPPSVSEAPDSDGGEELEVSGRRRHFPPQDGTGLSIYMDEELDAYHDQVPPVSAVDMFTFIQDTRVDSIRRLSLSLWSLVVALSYYFVTPRTPVNGSGCPDPNLSTLARQQHLYNNNNFSSHFSEYGGKEEEGDGDYDYVDSSASEVSSDTEQEYDDLLAETAGLVGDFLTEEPQHASTALSFLARTLQDAIVVSPNSDTRVVTRSMSASQHTLPSTHIMNNPQELNILADLIRTKREQRQLMSITADDNSMMCVICWRATRCIMIQPCRCLCLCNNCRLALAARRFEHCPCCRRNVDGYCRVYAV